MFVTQNLIRLNHTIEYIQLIMENAVWSNKLFYEFFKDAHNLFLVTIVLSNDHWMDMACSHPHPMHLKNAIYIA